MSLSEILRSGYCTRWHCNPDLAHVRETLAEHHGRVVQIILALHPAPSFALIYAAAHHDCGEMVVGDLPGPFKQTAPELAAVHADLEDAARCRMGVRAFRLSPLERSWLGLADKLAAVLHVKQVRPELLQRDDWQGDIRRCLEGARGLGCLARVTEALS